MPFSNDSKEQLGNGKYEKEGLNSLFCFRKTRLGRNFVTKVSTPLSPRPLIQTLRAIISKQFEISQLVRCQYTQ